MILKLRRYFQLLDVFFNDLIVIVVQLNAENSSLHEQIIEGRKELEKERKEKEKALRNHSGVRVMCDQLFDEKKAAEGEVHRLKEAVDDLTQKLQQSGKSSQEVLCF